MNGRHGLVAGAALAASAPLVLSAALTALATRPGMAARVFGGEPSPVRHPSELDLDADDVEYAPGCTAWWIPAADAVASVVIVHGFDTGDDPRATDPGPRLELAAILGESGYNCLVISLGYGAGVHLHSGGALEADDIAAAVKWAGARADVPVAVIGFSAGGHAAVTATDRMHVFAVVTDGSFTNFGQIVIEQGVEALSAPAWMFRPVRHVMKLATGRAPVDLAAWPVDTSMPMLHIHGEADTAISFDNLARLAAVTGGETLEVADADHNQSIFVDAERYTGTMLSFLERSLAEFDNRRRATAPS